MFVRSLPLSTRILIAFKLRRLVKPIVRSNVPSQILVKIIVTRNLPLQSVLRDSLFSLTANFFTWNKAYSLYPLSTFISHDAYLFRRTHLNKYILRNKESFENRGWKFEHTQWPEANIAEGHHPMRRLRCVTDKFAWVIPFDTEGVNASQTPEYVVDCSIFSVDDREGPIEELLGIYHYRVSAPEIASSVLRYRFICGSFSWECFLRKILDYKVLEELHKLSEDARPDNFQELVENPDRLHRRLDIERPDGWNYCDDQIPMLYKEWQMSIVGPVP